MHIKSTATADKILERIGFAEHQDPLGMGVRVRAEHPCMSLRGARAAGAR